MGPVSTFGAPTYTVTGGSDPRSLDMRLAQELIAARVSAESAVRRAELVEAERSRLQQTLAENQVGGVGEPCCHPGMPTSTLLIDSHGQRTCCDTLPAAH
jgi:hypothetical protein